MNRHIIAAATLLLLGAGCPLSPTPKLPPETVACTMEAKLCPDGSYVGRQGPNCEFAPCPTTPTPQPPPSEPEPVACTLDAKACPDGSYVGRVPPSCEFAPCPPAK